MRSHKRLTTSARWTGSFTTNAPRAYRRAQFEMPVSVHNGRTRRGIVTNLSASGAVLTMDEPPAKGSLVEIEFRAPGDDEKLRLLGEVRWHEREDAREDDATTTDVGISFQNLGSDGLALLREIVDARCA